MRGTGPDPPPPQGGEMQHGSGPITASSVREVYHYRRARERESKSERERARERERALIPGGRTTLESRTPGDEGQGPNLGLASPVLSSDSSEQFVLSLRFLQRVGTNLENEDRPDREGSWRVKKEGLP